MAVFLKLLFTTKFVQLPDIIFILDYAHKLLHRMPAYTLELYILLPTQRWLGGKGRGTLFPK